MTTTTAWLEPDLKAALDTLPESAILALTLYGEARSEPIEGIVAVGNVIQARVVDKRWPDTVRGVCLQPFQFSTWNDIGGANNLRALRRIVDELAAGIVPTDEAFEECAAVSVMLLKGALRNRCKGSNHYHSASMQPRPNWAQHTVPVAQVGAHVFYRL